MASSSIQGECPICAEEYHQLRILPCNHRLCLTCLQRVSREGEIECPICRLKHTTPNPNQLPSIFFGLLNCNICLEDHPSSHFYWCPTCVQIICPLCHIDVHSPTGHLVHKWNTLQAISDCYCHSEKLAVAEKVTEKPSADGIKKIREFCSEVENLLVEKFRGACVHADKKIPFHECLHDLFGELDISGANDLSETGNVSHLEGVSQQILKLAMEGNTEGFSNHSL